MPDPTAPTSKPATPASGSELPPRLLAKLKVEIEGYELIDRLGEGGQATVYKAIQKQDGQTVAVKVLHAGPHATEEARARLKREINALRAINHPNIVQAIAAGRTRSGLDCLVMNFIEGRPLDDLWNDPAFAAKVAPQPADVLRLFKTICETVQAAHRKGITHRDLSPSNILIDATGQPHILDFGMASTAFDGIVTRNVTVTGQFIGKLKYASPEQASGARTADANGNAAGTGVDIRSDVYALGVMLYQLLTGGAFPYEVVGNVIDVLNN
ncbi:MAG: serine/threonine-protein kinase, partial [Phycisphaerales bacterium]